MKLDSDQLSKLKPFLSLNEQEFKVYSALLSLGSSSTLGQISLQSGVNIIITEQSLQTLLGRDFVKAVPGITRRYYALEPFLDSYIRLFDTKSLQGLLDIITKSLRETPLSLIDDESMFKEYIETKLQNQKNKFLSTLNVDEDQQKFIEKAIIDTVEIISNTAFSIITDVETRGKKHLERAAKQFQKNAASLLAAISETQARLKDIFELSRQYPAPEEYTTDLLIGEGAILLAMRDFIPRTKESILIFMPIPDPKSLVDLVDLSNRRDVDINVVGNLLRTPKSILAKVKSEGVEIKMHQNETIDFWGIIKDNNEILIAPMPDNTDVQITGFYTSKSTLVKYFSEHLKKYTRFAPNM